MHVPDRGTALGRAATAAFVATAGLGVWAAYDRAAAGRKFVLILAGVVVALLLPVLARRGGRRVVAGLPVVVVPLAGVLAVLGLVGSPGHRGAIAGALAIVLPLAASGIRRGAAGSATASLATWSAVVLGLLALALAREGAAWGALSGAALFAVWAQGRFARRPTPASRLAGALVVVALLAALAVSVHGVAATGPAASPWLPDTLRGRVAFWKAASVLAADYVFTGAGLTSTGMALSSYVWLLHVPFTEHVHHLFLEIAVEQGAAGAVAFLLMLVTAARVVARRLVAPDGRRHPHHVAAGASLVALVLYGAFESDLYGSALVPLLFLPVGVAWMLAAASALPVAPARRQPGPWAAGRLAGLALAACVLVAGAALLPGSAQFQANLGAVAQTRAELTVYRWPAWGIQDALRRDPRIDLAPAIARYRRALALEAGNVTALRRLGQIALSRGDDPAARELLTTAHARAPRQAATRQMLGELCAVAGDIDGAARWWAETGNAHGQLDARAWWYGHIGDVTAQERIRQVIDRLDRDGAGRR